METAATLERPTVLSERLGKAVAGKPHTIGSGFIALHFSEDMFSGRMNPLLMVDHFVMTAPTFDPHLHAGISVVTAMFEDSDGAFLNRDTLGDNIALRAGDLYWLTAASGAAHEEKPEVGARTHALQIFVNLPDRLKKAPARAFLVEAKDVPVLETPKSRVRVVLGRSGAAIGADGTPEQMTMLDGFLQASGKFTHHLPGGRQAWIYALAGSLDISVKDERLFLLQGTATTVASGSEADIVMAAEEDTHFVLLAANPIREPFVKRGPLVMSTAADVEQTLAGYANGSFGEIVG